ncbi:ABC transporter ATP-binding protein [Paracoccus aminophilus]|uniref:ABC-type nitrate/sulfonate/bicarbonate transport system, ATPase component n=1 Tax=Paracoccus aminophilus JCM 7686 TaxID=1367847 RepID=S5Z1P8_PARAH|nr:ABC transporter ATP-binding protein [Paracoccus aminophilus]AGT11366.1 ABC-type nitrate/sulfonate/bicarbonate transport system, ATPase component [Paracoccus aminophilus JCM 7686]
MADTLTDLPAPAGRPAAAGQVSLTQVRRSFTVRQNRVEALSDVSLEVAAGEFLAVVGPSGCGKSSLLRLLAGLDFPDHGRVAIDGEPVRKPSLSRGIVFQDHRLLPWLTVSKNIALALKVLPGTNAEKAERVRELIELVGLSGFEEALPHQLSGGMSQRAAIARGLAPRPALLLLDEPFGALDSLNRVRLQDELLAIRARESSTVVLITHDVEEAIYLADRVVVMASKPGRIIAEVPVPLAHIRDRNSREFVALRHQVTGLINARSTAEHAPA